MYWQILVLPEYRKLQNISWRLSSEDELIDYELNTMTYGTHCAPFLALRVLKSITIKDCAESDRTRDALLNQTYVDDVSTSTDSVTDMLKLQSDLILILCHAGLELKKWSSNTSDVLDVVLSDHRVSCPPPFDTKKDIGIKVLGIQWHPIGDYFYCALRLDAKVTYTKRGLLSLIVRFFDPLGVFR